MKNVTISMDEETLGRVRVEAARLGQSVSRWVARRIAAALGEADEKAAASARIDAFLESFPGIPLSENGKITIDREEMYDERFRRFDHPALHPGSDRRGETGNVRGVAEGPSSRAGVDPEPSGSQ
ncbi:MAG: hypothetical protein ACR2FH_07900 [Caulobacteraceae bacterium]